MATLQRSSLEAILTFFTPEQRCWVRASKSASLEYPLLHVLCTGGCSSHNTLICFRPFPEDCDDWVKLGAEGWTSESMQHYGDRIKNYIAPVAP